MTLLEIVKLLIALFALLYTVGTGMLLYAGDTEGAELFVPICIVLDCFVIYIYI